MTCGDETCRRRQHAEACRRWRKQNRDVTLHHYEDAVVPFRNRRQTYQREWRLLRSLRKIRDTIAPVLLAIREPLSRLIRRAERILAARSLDKQRFGTRTSERDRFADAARLMRRIAISVDELSSLLRQLESMDEH